MSNDSNHKLNPMEFEEVKDAVMVPSTFDPKKKEKGKITFTLTAPGMVRVFVRPKERRFILLRTIINWEDKKPGTYEVFWDGYDANGNLLDPGKYRISIQAQPLRHSVDDKELPWDPDPHLKEENILYFPAKDKRVHAHCVHDKDKCIELKVKITSPANGATIKGKVKVVREISEQTRGYGKVRGHSARFYIDYMLLQENKEERGTLAEWTWDTSDIPPGKHILTATCCDHSDHMGSDSIIVNVVK